MSDLADSERANQSPADDDSLAKIARYVEEIELYDKATEKWRRQSKRIRKRYKDDRGGDGTVESQERRFNALWANTQNLLPALYARNPKPDIQRRFKDADPVGRVVSDVLERSVSYFCDTDHFAATSRQCVLDFLLPGRGSSWVRYVPTFKAVEVTDDVTKGDGTSPQAVAPQQIDYEDVAVDYVHPGDMGHNVCRTWDEVWCVWRKVYLTRKEMMDRFAKRDGGVGKLDAKAVEAIPLDYKQQDDSGKVIDDGVGKAIIYEAWDKIRRVAVWFHKSIPTALDVRPDPLGLENFFPTPKPLLANLTNDSLIPTPFFVEYQDQAAELDALTNRIAQMTRNLKVVGIYDGSADGPQRMFNEGTENELIPVKDWIGLQEKGGLDNVYSLAPMDKIAKTLVDAYSCREQVKRDLDEITGMSDIVRGATDPDETATAQKLKSGYAGQRISDLQRDVQRFIRETIRLMTNVICNHFQDETIKTISGVRLFTKAEKMIYAPPAAPAMQGAGGPLPPGAPGSPPAAPGVAPPKPPLPPNVTQDQLETMLDAPTWEDVFALIRNKALRSFRIDIETDSTIKSDEEAEKASRVEFLKASGAFLQQAVEAGQQQPALVPLLSQMLMFGVRAFPVGKELEGTFQSTLQKLEKEAANPQPKPDPEMAKVQAQAQIEQQKLQQSMQLEQMKLDATTKADAQRNMLEAGRDKARIQSEMQLELFKAKQEGNIAIRKAYIDAAKAVEVARVAAGQDGGEDFVARAEALEQSGSVPSFQDAPSPGAQSQPEANSGEDDMDTKKVVELHQNAEAKAQERHQQMMTALGQVAQAHKQSGMANVLNGQQVQANHTQLLQALTGEKELVRDPQTGKATGVRPKMVGNA